MSTEVVKHKVSTDALETLGSIIGPDEKRDAIHIAVEPVQAHVRLKPGQDVGDVGDGTYATTKNNVGIVDPFLKSEIQEGEWFWLLVYPRQITSLRHVWSHPAFAEAEVYAEPQKTDTINPSERWIRDFAAGVGLKYDVLMGGAKRWYESHDGQWGNEYLCFGGLLEGEFVPDEFWDHYVTVTGEDVPENKRGSFFTCSC